MYVEKGACRKAAVLEVWKCTDVDLYGSAYNKNDICKNIQDSMILGVVGKLQAVG